MSQGQLAPCSPSAVECSSYVASTGYKWTSSTSAQYSAAQLWDKAQANQEFQLDKPKTRRKLVAFLRSVFTLVPMAGKIGSQAISNISWASAKLGIDLDTFEPGLTCKLVAGFANSIQASEAKYRPNAQNSANFFWALGVWKDLPPDAAFSIMWAHSVALVEDAEQSLTPQNSSNLLYALAQLGLAVTRKDAQTAEQHSQPRQREPYCPGLWQHSMESSCLGTVAH